MFLIWCNKNSLVQVNSKLVQIAICIYALRVERISSLNQISSLSKSVNSMNHKLFQHLYKHSKYFWIRYNEEKVKRLLSVTEFICILNLCPWKMYSNWNKLWFNNQFHHRFIFCGWVKAMGTIIMAIFSIRIQFM